MKFRSCIIIYSEEVHTMTHNLDIFSKMKVYKAYGPTTLRIMIGLLFVLHGIGKIWGAGLPPGGWEAWSGMATSMLGIPLFFAYLVAWGELVGGLFLITGFLTRYWTIFLSIIIIAAILMVKIKDGFMAAELDWAYLVILISLFFTGAGKWSVDEHKCKNKEKDIASAS